MQPAGTRAWQMRGQRPMGGPEQTRAQVPPWWGDPPPWSTWGPPVAGSIQPGSPGQMASSSQVADQMGLPRGWSGWSWGGWGWNWDPWYAGPRTGGQVGGPMRFAASSQAGQQVGQQRADPRSMGGWTWGGWGAPWSWDPWTPVVERPDALQMSARAHYGGSGQWGLQAARPVMGSPGPMRSLMTTWWEVWGDQGFWLWDPDHPTRWR
jgi:hypothetical protein